ncbi:MAG: RHS repeat-associated core domain-containing protein, partial [Lentisphaerae bacterium]|nr:RHS repeat-associated core domain-containing protein [Lentisphaerota bacterium]
QLVNAADGSVAAHYEYDPFGNLIKAEGEYKDGNPYRFSTKYRDSETGLYYYGFRYYSTELGRWISRDPIGEHGFRNYSTELGKKHKKRLQNKFKAYNFVFNNPLNNIDILGLIKWDKSCNCMTYLDKVEAENNISYAVEAVKKEIAKGWSWNTSRWPDDVLTQKMGRKIVTRLQHINIKCWGKDNIACRASIEGFALPWGNVIRVCAETILRGGFYSSDQHTALFKKILHESIHCFGKSGHGAPDGPYIWENKLALFVRVQKNSI